MLFNATVSSQLSPIKDRYQELEKIGIKITKNVKSSIARSVDNYAFLSFEFLKLQKMLEQTGRYLLSNEKDALTQVYLNEEVFSKYYLEGLLLSEALWPNHYLINRFFHKSFIQKVNDDPIIIETGIGTGYHLDQIIESISKFSYLGFDISPSSIEFAKNT